MNALRLTGLCAVVFSLMIVTPARADSIDGQWCQTDGVRQLSINGTSIITPAGKRITGDYSRHAFSYTAPVADMGDGQVVSMILVNEETAQLRIGAAPQTPTQIWRRCGMPVS